MKLIRILVLILTVVAFGCKSTKSITSKGKLNANMTAKELIWENQTQKARFKTLQAKVKIEYTQDERSEGYTVNLRMEKDKIIWINSVLGLARVMITPDRVSFYDKINNQYFDGDYRLLSDLLGIDLDFKKVESLLLGESIYNLEVDKYKLSTQENSYVLEPKMQQAVLELFFLLNPSHFKMDSQQLYQPLKRRILEIDYKSYQKVNKQILPENLKIIAVEDTDQVTIEMEYRSVSLNEDLRFPFKIPSGFKEISIANAE
jgi:outer membrane biogenesis lipoprotein LolB